jgi:hypothetical protein
MKLAYICNTRRPFYGPVVTKKDPALPCGEVDEPA